MPKRPQKAQSRMGEFEEIENEPRLNREPQRPSSMPEIEFVTGIGSTTGVMRIRREDDDKTTQGDEDNPL
ncbi:MAG: hypothetical protein Phog2KO_43900 [Phototrophicaceae bacterium]